MFDLIDEVIKNGGGCTKLEYKTALKELSKIKELKLLVFSCGHDSILWKKMTDNVIFIEDNAGWANIARKKFDANIKLVKYGSQFAKHNRYLAEQEEIDTSCLDILRGLEFNAVFIDGPIGYGNGPGRMIPIKWTSMMVGVEKILVHDYNRVVERAFCIKYFSDNYNLQLHVEKLGVFDRKAN